MRGRSDPLPDQAPSTTEPSLASDGHASIAATLKREVVGPPAATTPDVASSDTVRHENPAALAIGGAPAAVAAAATPASHPRTVDPSGGLRDDGAFGERYGFRHVLGEGGMGEVRLYRDDRIGRDVAVKVLRRGRGTPPGSHRSSADAEPRFLREARVQGQLEHPAIVPVYDLGKDPDGQPFFTMKRVRGKTLEDIVGALRSGDADAAQRYSRRKLLTAFSQVCLAIDFAHSRGVIHRDLKPGNVMLGDFGEVYVLDWGIARVAGVPDLKTDPSLEPVTDDGARTADGETLGTPGYMAPEQIRGDASLDARADVYALGCILFELLALEPLHKRTVVTAILASTLHGIDARPSLRAPDQDVPPELDATCARACALAPDDRFSTARELCNAVDSFLDGDRDLERRRELAAVHAENAARAGERALAATPPTETEELELRREAMREAGRALALDPQQSSALETVVRLLSRAPHATPPEATEGQTQTVKATFQSAGRRGAIAYLAWLTATPFILAMGVREPMAALTSAAAIVLAACFSYWVSRRPELGERLSWAPLVIGTIAIVIVGCIAGPLFLLPTMAVGHVVGFALHRGRLGRGIVLGIGLATVAIPMALEATGLIGPHYVFANGTLTILPGLTELPEIPTRVFLVLSGLGSVVVTVFIVGQVRDALSEAEKMLQVQAWQLRQLVPAAAQAIASEQTPARSSHFCLVSALKPG